MKEIQCIQGSPEWFQIRLYFQREDSKIAP